MARKPAVAGFFYPGRRDELETMMAGMVDPDRDKERAFCVVSPHAGFMYSGPVAGAVFSFVILPQKQVILGPNHRPVQSRIAIVSRGRWSTPLGEVRVDTDLAERIKAQTSLIVEDEQAHAHEHSLEVQLPFLQYLRESIAIVPLSVAYQASFEEMEELGQGIARAIQEIQEDTLIVASSDMSHYVSQETAREKDFMAIERILDLDARGLYEIVRRENISMCGFQPTTAALVASKILGASKGTLVKYQTSGDVTGDFREVVGYAGIAIT